MIVGTIITPFVRKDRRENMESDKTPNVSGERKLTLLLVTTALYLGGTQKIAYILANALSERHNVIVAYCLDSERRHPYGEKCVLRKLPEYDNGASLLKKIGVIRKQVKALRSIKKEFDVDAALSLGNLSNLINALSRGKERVVCSERSNPKRSWGAWFFPITRLIFGRSDYVVFQSERVRNLYGRRIRQKSRVLKNPLHIPEPANERREKKIVALGRLAPQKNHALLVRSFAKFHETFPEHKLHIFGDGELENSLKSLIDSLNMSDHIFLEKNDPNALERIRDAEMFVLSSDFEGLSNALLECMSMGIACISTKCEGSVDVVRCGENGLLVDVGDEDALTQAMRLLAGNPSLRRNLERKATADIRAYDKDVVVEDWERVVQSHIN